MSTPATQPRDAHSWKAQAKADKAYKKAMRPWYKKKRFILPLVLIALLVIVSIANSGDNAQTPGASQNQADTGNQVDSGSQATTATIGQPATDGKFEFTVTEVEAAGDSIGQSFAPQEAQGTWQLVHVNVKNTGQEAAMLDANSQEAYDASGNEYSAQTVASLEDFDKAFLNQINPGNTVKDAVIPFDVPEGTKLTKVTLHDSMFSGGVEVDLNK